MRVGERVALGVRTGSICWRRIARRCGGRSRCWRCRGTRPWACGCFTTPSMRSGMPPAIPRPISASIPSAACSPGLCRDDALLARRPLGRRRGDRGVSSRAGSPRCWRSRGCARASSAHSTPSPIPSASSAFAAAALAPRDQPGDVAHLAARAAARPCRRDGAWRSGSSSASRQFSTSSPIRFFITASEWRSGEPSGRPQIARTSCSNWLVMQASIVQWPELCGRGASSLTSTSPSWVDEHLDREQADEVELLGDAAGDRLGARRDLGRHRRRRDGGVEDVVDVPVLDRRIGRACRRPRRARRSPRSRRRNRRSLRGSPSSVPKLRHAAARSVAGADRHLALAVIAEPHGLEHRGPADAPARLGELRPRCGPRHSAWSAMPMRAQEILLLEPVLRDAEHRRARAAPA